MRLLCPIYDEAVRKTIEQFEAAGSPVVTDGEQRLVTLDCVIANPSFSLKELGRDLWEEDLWPSPGNT